MKAILLIVSALLQQLVYSLKNDTRRKYLDANFFLTSRNKMVYPAITFRSNDHSALHATYANNSPLITAHFSDKNLTASDGLYTLYYSKKNKAADGYYKNGYRTGVWK
jgi:hypothetical protein